MRTDAKDKDEDKDKDKDEDEDEDKDKLASLRQTRAKRKRPLKNNSQITIDPNDLFVPFWEIEGVTDESS